MKKLLLFLLTAMAVVDLSAAGIKLRTGNALAGEVSFQNVEIKDADDITLAPVRYQKAFVALTLTVDPGRTLSVFDYKLRIGRGWYPCVAIRQPRGKFSIYPFQIDVPGDNKYTLLFIIDRRAFRNNQNLTAVLHVDFPPRERADIEIEFTNIGNKALTDSEKISDQGLFK